MLNWLDDLNSTSLYPLSDQTILLATSWINECAESHSKCNVRCDTYFTPTRLIDVGSHGRSPRLVETASQGLSDLKYSALSHCWGTVMPHVATMSTKALSKSLRKIPIRTLPRTFRDAILATRRLGLQYKWIDSLCIIQDFPDDWQT